jgi:hypothetical protein
MLLFGDKYLKNIALFATKVLGFNQIKIYGKVDPSARIVVFNHPTLSDPFIVQAVNGPISGLILDKFWASAFFEYALGCVRVSHDGNQNTRERLLQTLKSNNRRYAIAVNRHNDPGVGGRTQGDSIETFKTIAFRLGESIQPMVIIAENNVYAKPNINNIDVLNVSLRTNQPIRVYLLPKMTQKSGESPEQFAERTKRAMNACLKLGWQYDPKPDNPVDSSLVISSLLFTTMIIHAFARKYWIYGLAWMGLTITSVLNHSTPADTWRLIDKVMVYIVVGIGLLVLLRKKNYIIPVITFVAVIILYFGNIGHHSWIHILSLIGHHAILLV